MYLIIVVMLMAVAPVVFVLGDYLLSGGDFIWLIGKWFVFWGVGARLGLAAVRQIARPGLTSRGLLGIGDRKAELPVRELGFANLAIALISVMSLLLPGWVVPSALAGGVFFALAGLEHLRHPKRKSQENVALVSDLAIAVVLLGFVLVRLIVGAA